MNKIRKSFWTTDMQSKYAIKIKRREKKALAERNGQFTAENLDRIWTGLSNNEKKLIEYLILSEKPTLVALFDDGLFTSLMSKGILKIPQGVSTVFIQSHQTTYTIPQAVWTSLQKKQDLFPTYEKSNKKQRIKKLSKKFESQIEALLSRTSSMDNLK